MTLRGALAVAVIASAVQASAAVSITSRAAVASPSRYATQAAVQILARGGSAADAAVAGGFVLGVVEPQRAGIGGDAMLLYFEKSTGAVWALDARELSPLSLDDKAVHARYAKPESRSDGILSVCVPSFVRGAFEAHERFGRMAWSDLLAPSIALARDGFVVDDALSIVLGDAQKNRRLDSNAAVAKLFFPGGKPVSPGSTLVQSDLSATLEKISRNAGDFYDGATTKRLVTFLRGAGSPLGFRDFRELTAVWRAPLRVEYGGYSVFATPPPSAGGVSLADQLALANALGLSAPRGDDSKSTHLFCEIERRALSDVSAVGDPEATRLPFRDLFSDERAKQMRASISADHVTPAANTTSGLSRDRRDAAQLVVVDADGNAAALIVSLGDPLGSGVFAEGLGFFLNDAMADFADVNAGNSAKKRPATAFAPAIVLRDGAPYLVIGSNAGDGSARLTMETFLSVANGKSLQDAVESPRFHQRVSPDEVVYETSRTSVAFAQKLNDAGHASSPMKAFGDVQAILCEKKTMTAVSDSRHGGATGGY